MAYKNVKEEEIKRVANLYKDKIPLKLYNAMMNYVVIQKFKSALTYK